MSRTFAPTTPLLISRQPLQALRRRRETQHLRDAEVRAQLAKHIRPQLLAGQRPYGDSLRYPVGLGGLGPVALAATSGPLDDARFDPVWRR